MALYLEPRECYDKCIIGLMYSHNRDYLKEQRVINDIELVAYDYEKLIDSLIIYQQWSYEDSQDWIEYNILGNWMGKGTPIIVMPE